MEPQVTNWILGIGAALIAIGVAGVWSGLTKLGTSLSALQATVSAWTKVFEDRFVVVTDLGHDHEKRIGSLEGRSDLHAHRIRTIENRSRIGLEGEEE